MLMTATPPAAARAAAGVPVARNDLDHDGIRSADGISWPWADRVKSANPESRRKSSATSERSIWLSSNGWLPGSRTMPCQHSRTAREAQRWVAGFRGVAGRAELTSRTAEVTHGPGVLSRIVTDVTAGVRSDAVTASLNVAYAVASVGDYPGRVG